MNKDTYTIKFGANKFVAPKGELLLFSLMENDIYSQGKAHGRSRGGFCGMGVCQECLVELEDGTTALACQTLVEENMEIRDE